MISARWIEEFRRQVRRGKHVVLHGSIRDLVLYQGAFLPLGAVLDDVLQGLGYALRARHNPIDGIIFPDGPTRVMRTRFEALLRDPSLDEAAATSAYAPPGGAAVAISISAPPQATATAAPYLADPALAISAFRIVMSGAQGEAVSAILDFSDKLVAGDEHQPPPERELLITLGLAAQESHRHMHGTIAGMRNAFVLTAASLGQVPAWLYRDNPLFAVVQVERPNAAERAEFVRQRFEGYFGADAGDPPPPAVVEDLAALTDGLSHWDLEAMRLTSHHERLPVHEPRPLVDFFKHGTKDDPWEQLGLETLRQARTTLAKKVIGQEAAVDKVMDVLVSARGGVQLDAGRGAIRPKGVLFFVGPTGVGKTELAKAITELIFRDPTAFARFDMSEYAQEHAAERLTGAPPSYVGYEAGGQLTNRMKTRPFSLLLFDEIEKAHPRIMDKFLQVLDDGRLTDGLGETVYFAHSIIVFTSNIGSTRVVERNGVSSVTSALRADMTYAEVQAHYRQEVKDHFIRMGRPELLGRIGEENIVVFDMLRPQHVGGILEKFMAGIAGSVREKYGLGLRVEPEVLEFATVACRQPDVTVLGGRGIRNFVQSTVLPRVNEAVLTPGGGQDLVLRLEDGRIVVRR